MNLELGFVAGDNERKYFGAYYTPPSIARILANWAIRSPTDRILEPSFGDGAFLEAAASRLISLPGETAGALLAGTDIDRAATLKAAARLTRHPIDVDLRHSDFLAIEPRAAWDAFDVILGNPPYVRHHRIEKGTIADLRRRELKLTRGSDLWCSFVAHSLTFLRPGGRLALILPGSFLFARYAVAIRSRLAENFASVAAIRLAYPAFAASGTDERGVVILCAGFGGATADGWDEQVAWDDGDLEARVALLGRGVPAGEAAALNPQIATRKLGDLAKIGIGFVTGANRTFIVDRQTQSRFDLPSEALVPVVARTAQTPSIRFSGEDHAQAVADNSRVWLFAPSALGERGGPVRRYLATVPLSQRRNTLWFRKRPHWYRPQTGTPPDAVFTYMNHLGPRIVLLDGIEGATNTFHVLEFYDRPGDPPRQLVALAMLTTLAQLSAERIGRPYGGGVLKIEPSEAREIDLPIPDDIPETLDAAFARADRLLRDGDAAAATRVADELLVAPMLGENFTGQLAAWTGELEEARTIRLPRPASQEGRKA